MEIIGRKPNTIDEMQSYAILAADQWFETLGLQEQLFCQELARRVASQMVVMNFDGDRRRGWDQFPDAWEHVKNPPLKKLLHENQIFHPEKE